MEIIEHAGQEHNELEWLTTPGLAKTWHVYLKDWVAAREPLASLEFPGDMTLAEVVEEMQDHLDEEYGFGNYPFVIISAEPIETFYPETRKNIPEEIAFFDGGSWYMTQLLECGEYLNGSLRL